MFKDKPILPKGMKLVTGIVMTSKEDAKTGGDELVEAGFKPLGNGVFKKDDYYFEIGYDPKLKEMYVEHKIEEKDAEVTIQPKKRKKRIKPAQKNKKK